MLENVKNLLSDGVTALGGILIVFGLVNLGLTIKDGMQGGGGQLSGALAMIIGGAIVVGGAVYFKTGINWGSLAGYKGAISHMLSVAVHKDIAEYQPKIVGKMTMRTLVSITGALSVSVLAGLYIYFVLGLNVSDCTFFIYAVSLPFWCVGFVKPCGMPFEQFAPLWLKANFTNDRIFYQPSMRLAGLLSESENSKQKGTIYGKHYRKQGNLRGIESYSPRAGRVIS